jgi:phosphoribosylanthranilate isomerase
MSYRLRIKICGVTSAADAVEAARLGADAVGLNFSPQSPRRVDESAAREILRELPPFVMSVVVFTSLPACEMVLAATALGGVPLLQRHCAEHDVADVQPFRLIDAFQVPGRHSLSYIVRYLEEARSAGRSPAGVLVDGSAPGQFGGTGQTAPWQALSAFRPGVPLILAGGLTPDNVANAVRIVRPYAVDVASGVESAPGKKDAEKMKRFIQNAREAAANL